jgi:hypothetical protein
MISTRQSILMVAMTAFGAVSPMAAMAQEEEDQVQVSEIDHENEIETGDATNNANNVE